VGKFFSFPFHFSASILKVAEKEEKKYESEKSIQFAQIIGFMTQILSILNLRNRPLE